MFLYFMVSKVSTSGWISIAEEQYDIRRRFLANYDYDFATIQFNYTLPAAMHFMQKFSRQPYLLICHMESVGSSEFGFCHTIVEGFEANY